MKILSIVSKNETVDDLVLKIAADKNVYAIEDPNKSIEFNCGFYYVRAFNVRDELERKTRYRVLNSRQLKSANVLTDVATGKVTSVNISLSSVVEFVSGNVELVSDVTVLVDDADLKYRGRLNFIDMSNFELFQKVYKFVLRKLKFTYPVINERGALNG